jgi:hypothetical protein
MMTACKSAGPNELTNSCVVGVADGEGDGSAGDFDGFSGGLPDDVGAGDVGVGDCARRFAAKIEILKIVSKNRDITVIFRCYQ